jgi:hypothetical protein
VKEVNNSCSEVNARLDVSKAVDVVANYSEGICRSNSDESPVKNQRAKIMKNTIMPE